MNRVSRVRLLGVVTLSMATVFGGAGVAMAEEPEPTPDSEAVATDTEDALTIIGPSSWDGITMTVSEATVNFTGFQAFNPGPCVDWCGDIQGGNGTARVTLTSDADVAVNILVEQNDPLVPAVSPIVVQGLTAGAPVVLDVPLSLPAWDCPDSVAIRATMLSASDLEGLLVTAPVTENWSTVYTGVEPISSINLSATSGFVGRTVAFEASYFKPNEEVAVTLHSGSIPLATVTADGAGVVSGSFVVPELDVTGNHSVVFTGIESGANGSTPFVVESLLAETGANGSLAAVAALLLATGALGMVARRRAS